MLTTINGTHTRPGQGARGPPQTTQDVDSPSKYQTSHEWRGKVKGEASGARLEEVHYWSMITLRQSIKWNELGSEIASWTNPQILEAEEIFDLCKRFNPKTPNLVKTLHVKKPSLFLLLLTPYTHALLSCRTKSHADSFIPNTASLWNSLPGT